jgi:hypothetical protein
MLQYRETAAPGWRSSAMRRRLALKVGATGLAAILTAGLALSIADLVNMDTGGARTHQVERTDARDLPARTQSSPPRPMVDDEEARARDALAARPMPDTGTGNAYGRPELSTRDPGAPIILPPARSTGPWGVQTGYPQTPDGAIAQLGALDVAMLRSASPAGVRAVIREWVAPGGPTASSWSWVKGMTSLLESIGVEADGTARLNIDATPTMGLIKGTVGDDFVVACVDLTIDITFGGTSRTVAVDCQRMLWDGQHWEIGPGPEPAPAPSVWPYTDAAIDAGYKDLLPAPTSSHGEDR